MLGLIGYKNGVKEDDNTLKMSEEANKTPTSFMSMIHDYKKKVQEEMSATSTIAQGNPPEETSHERETLSPVRDELKSLLWSQKKDFKTSDKGCYQKSEAKDNPCEDSSKAKLMIFYGNKIQKKTSTLPAANTTNQSQLDFVDRAKNAALTFFSSSKDTAATYREEVNVDVVNTNIPVMAFGGINPYFNENTLRNRSSSLDHLQQTLSGMRKHSTDSSGVTDLTNFSSDDDSVENTLIINPEPIKEELVQDVHTPKRITSNMRNFDHHENSTFSSLKRSSSLVYSDIKANIDSNIVEVAIKDTARSFFPINIENDAVDDSAPIDSFHESVFQTPKKNGLANFTESLKKSLTEKSEVNKNDDTSFFGDITSRLKANYSATKTPKSISKEERSQMDEGDSDSRFSFSTPKFRLDFGPLFQDHKAKSDDDEVEILMVERHADILREIKAYAEVLSTSEGSMGLCRAVNDELGKQFSSVAYCDGLVEYFSNRPDLIQYTMEKELHRMRYKVRVCHDDDTERELILEVNDEICNFLLNGSLNEEEKTCFALENKAHDFLFRAANQSLLADPVEVLLRCSAIGPNVMKSVRVHDACFLIDTVEGFVQCDADLRVLLPIDASSSDDVSITSSCSMTSMVPSCQMELSSIKLSVKFNPGLRDTKAPCFECFVKEMTTNELQRDNAEHFDHQIECAARMIHECRAAPTFQIVE